MSYRHPFDPPKIASQRLDTNTATYARFLEDSIRRAFLRLPDVTNLPDWRVSPTAAETSAGVSPTLTELREGVLARYGNVPADLLSVYDKIVAGAEYVNPYNMLQGEYVLLGDPATSPFGYESTYMAGIQAALDMAEHMGKTVVFSGNWNDLEATTDPSSSSPARSAAFYWPAGVALIGQDFANSNFALADAADCQLCVLKDPTDVPIAAPFGNFVVNGNGSAQSSDGGGPLVDVSPVSSSPIYAMFFNLRIRNAYGSLFRLGTDMNGAMLHNSWFYNGGATGTGADGCSVQLNAADVIVLAIDCGMCAGCAYNLASGSRFFGVKAWRAGETDATHGHGYRMSLGNGWTQFYGVAQDNAAAAVNVFSTSTSQGGRIEVISDSNASGVVLGNNVQHAHISVEASDRGAGAYSHDYALKKSGTITGSVRNRLQVRSTDGAVVPIDAATIAALGDNNLEILDRRTSRYDFTYASTYEVDCFLYEHVATTLTGDITITAANQFPECRLVVTLTQDGSGGHTPTFDSGDFEAGSLTASAETASLRSRWVFSYDSVLGKFVEESARVDF